MSNMPVAQRWRGAPSGAAPDAGSSWIHRCARSRGCRIVLRPRGRAWPFSAWGGGGLPTRAVPRRALSRGRACPHRLPPAAARLLHAAPPRGARTVQYRLRRADRAAPGGCGDAAARGGYRAARRQFPAQVATGSGAGTMSICGQIVDKRSRRRFCAFFSRKATQKRLRAWAIRGKITDGRCISPVRFFSGGCAL